jgi:hypothetical protein
MNKHYTNAYGGWEVTTEGDVEGKTTKHLGTFIGYVDEIAFHLADKALYGLCFKRIPQSADKVYQPTATSVNISFDVESKTWDSVKTDSGLMDIEKIFANRPVKITHSNFFASFKLVSNHADEFIRAKALEKLSPKERELLGITD